MSERTTFFCILLHEIILLDVFLSYFIRLILHESGIPKNLAFSDVTFKIKIVLVIPKSDVEICDPDKAHSGPCDTCELLS